ncbi:hypothetical protein GA0070618_5590 [Micromonospora echinospora]|uniref:Uncharacterized protein n=1 Tax=Micromonospora echinospora TaxID=1877 RepID=A0A1C4ZQK5_MICEC|nr:hypothetical protein [Micromonospora echinospora]SCF35074.1 hypothetical protein GA0070618_5590 [Micromonospora echinospora]
MFFAVSPTADRAALKVIKAHLVEAPNVRERFAAEVDNLKLCGGERPIWWRF